MQSRNQSIIVRLTAILTTSLTLAVLSGCSVAMDAPPKNYNAPIEMAGLVLAGRNYMEFATVNVYETQPSGVATNGTYVGQAKLLATAQTSVTGTWTIDNVTCSSPDQLYVTATGGTPMPYFNNYTSLTNNPNSLMITAVGDCSTLTSQDNPRATTQIVTNEASSVAAVWALRPFMSISGTTVNITSDATNYGGTSGTGVIGNYAGLAHAFLNANNLTPYRQGAFSTYTNGANSIATGGLVPTQTLNALAYIQYLCTIGAVDGVTAGDFSLCTQLYALTTPTGGTAPTNSLQAMLNIANQPTHNAAGLMTFAQSFIPGSQAYNLAAGGEPQENYGEATSSMPGSYSIGPFVPALSSFCSGAGACATNDWTVAVDYGPGIGGNTLAGASAIQPSAIPIDLSLDANDNVYFSNPNASSAPTQANLVSISSSGIYRWGSNTDFTADVFPRGLAPDQFGNVWVVSSTGSPMVQQFDATTGALKNSYPGTGSGLYDLTVDSIGNIWYTNNSSTSASLHELVKSNNYAELLTAPFASNKGVSLQLRPDSNNNIWVAGYTQGKLLYLPNTSGNAAAPTYTQGLQSIGPSGTAPSLYGVAVDAAGNAYAAGGTAAGPGTMYKVTVTNPTSATASLSIASVASVPEYVATTTFPPMFMDTDGNGTIWFGDRTAANYMYSYVPSTSTVTSYYPCFANVPQAGVANSTTSTNFCGQVPSSTLIGQVTPNSGLSTRIDQALDSTGSIWVASYGNGRIVQIISPAAPTVPLRALGKIGMMP